MSDQRVHGCNRARLAGIRLRRGRHCLRSIFGVVVLDQLPDLFFERHLPQQAIHAGLNLWIGELSVRWMRDFARIVRRGGQSGLCRGMWNASSRYQAESGAGKAAFQIHSQHKISPGCGHSIARRIPTRAE
jgi:hypothetical protein